MFSSHKLFSVAIACIVFSADFTHTLISETPGSDDVQTTSPSQSIDHAISAIHSSPTTWTQDETSLQTSGDFSQTPTHVFDSISTLSPVSDILPSVTVFSTSVSSSLSVIETLSFSSSQSFTEPLSATALQAGTFSTEDISDIASSNSLTTSLSREIQLSMTSSLEDLVFESTTADSALSSLQFSSSEISLEISSASDTFAYNDLSDSVITPAVEASFSAKILPSIVSNFQSLATLPIVPSQESQPTASVWSTPTSSSEPTSSIVPEDKGDEEPSKKSTSSGKGGLSSGGKAAVGIVVTLCILGVIIGGVVLYRRYNFTHRSLKSFLTSGVAYKTYNNASYKDDEGMLIMPDRR